MRRVIITEEIQEARQGPLFVPRPVKRSWGRKLHRAALLVLALLWLLTGAFLLAAVAMYGRSPLALLWPVFPAFAASVFFFREASKL